MSVILDKLLQGQSFEWKKLGEVCDLVRGPFGGSLKKEIFVDDGYAVYEQNHAIYGKFEFRYFITEIQRSDKFRIDKFQKQDKKEAYLAMFIYFKRKELIDMVIEATSSYANTVVKRSRKKAKEHNIHNHMKLKTNSEKLKEVVKNILKINEIEDLKNYRHE